MNVPILKGVINFLIEPLLNLFAQHVDIGLINVSALFDEGDRVVDLDVLELGLFLLPVLVQNEEKLLCPARGEHWQ